MLFPVWGVCLNFEKIEGLNKVITCKINETVGKMIKFIGVEVSPFLLQHNFGYFYVVKKKPPKFVEF